MHIYKGGHYIGLQGTGWIWLEVGSHGTGWEPSNSVHEAGHLSSLNSEVPKAWRVPLVFVWLGKLKKLAGFWPQWRMTTALTRKRPRQADRKQIFFFLWISLYLVPNY